MRVTFRDKERRHWENWLPKDLAKRLDNIKKLVTHLYSTKEKHKPLIHFTPHGIEHCQAVEDNLHRLINGNKHQKLGESEKFFLLASAWLHDIGMLRGLTSEDHNLDDNTIRDTHHLRSSEHIANCYDEVGVKEEEAATLGILSIFHRRRCDILECPEHLTLPGHGTVRPQLLSAYLRLADALHIDSSRTPEKQYAISLAYNIPYKSKLHWYRSRFVIGVEYNRESKEIIIHLKKPSNKGSEIFKGHDLRDTYENIYNLIIQDLTEELDSVKNILIKGGFSYYLKITKKIHHVQVDERFLKDIKPVLSYYHLLDNPSSSALLSLVLESVQIILELDTSFAKEKGKVSISQEIKVALKQFILEINENVLSTRKCHIGLSNFIDRLDEKLKDDDFQKLKNWVNKQQAIIADNRKKIRESSCRYFLNFINNRKDLQIPEYSKRGNLSKGSDQDHSQWIINVLVYGYSELVMKSLCGFRDAVISHLVKSYSSSGIEPENRVTGELPLYHQAEIEERASNHFRIFCCEGQPKNHTTWTGRLHHHDGARYALALTQRGFKNCFIIPDAIATSLIASNGQDPKPPQIDLVMIGTNGFDKSRFKHSAGHSMVVSAVSFAKNLAAGSGQKAGIKSPVLILSLLTDKFHKATGIEEKSPKKGQSVSVGGWPFINGFENEEVRLHSFFTQDHNLQKDIAAQSGKIHYYNPREDSIDIKLVDVIISENCFLEKDKVVSSEKDWHGMNITKASKDNEKISK